jgi:hypothetical protein
MEVFTRLEGFYNCRRHHFRFGDLSPTDYEQQLAPHKEASIGQGALQPRSDPGPVDRLSVLRWCIFLCPVTTGSASRS